MDNNERDTHFQEFAELLFNNLSEHGLIALVDFRNFPGSLDRAMELQQNMNELTKRLIAQRAYDLALHILTELGPVAYEHMSFVEAVATIPDLTKWPKP